MWTQILLHCMCPNHQLSFCFFCCVLLIDAPTNDPFPLDIIQISCVGHFSKSTAAACVHSYQLSSASARRKCLETWGCWIRSILFHFSTSLSNPIGKVYSCNEDEQDITTLNFGRLLRCNGSRAILHLLAGIPQR